MEMQIVFKRFSAMIYIFTILQAFMFHYAFAAVKDFHGVGEYTMGEYETIVIAKEHAVQEAQRNALEQAGVYVKSYTKTKNLKVEEDTVTVLTNGILWVKDKKITKRTNEYGDIHIKAEILVSIDTDDIEKKLNNTKALENMQIEYNDLQQRYNELENEINQLRKSSSKEEAQKYTQELDKRIKIQSELTDIQEKVKAYSKEKSFEEKRAFETESINKISNLIKEDPSYGELYYARANLKRFSERLYFDSMHKRTEEAIDDYNIAEKLFINDNAKLAQIYEHRADCYFVLKQYDKQIEDITKLINIPEKQKVYKNYLLYLSRGDIYLVCQQYQKAIDDAESALQLLKNLPQKKVITHIGLYEIKVKAYRSLGKYREAINCYEKLIELHKTTSAYKTKPNIAKNVESEFLCDKAECFIKLGDYASAIADVNKSISLNVEKTEPSVMDVAPFLLRGEIYQKLNNPIMEIQSYTDGINYFRTAGIPKPKNLSSNAYEQFIEEWNAATSAMLYFNRGIAHHNSDDYIAAISDYNEYLNLDKNNHRKNRDWAYMNIARCYYAIDQKDTAIKYANKALEEHPHWQKAIDFIRLVES